MKSLHQVMNLTAVLLAAGLTVTGCVDNKYDLDQLDKTVTVGGDLTLPGSSTGTYTLGEVLDLKPNSAIRPVAAGEYGLQAGDYVLEQNTKPTGSSIDVPAVNLTDIKGSQVKVNIPNIPCGIPGGGIQEVPLDVEATAKLATSNVDPTITALTALTCDVPIEIVLGYNSPDYNGDIVFQNGYMISFDKSWTLAITDAATADFLEFVPGSTHQLRFKKTMTVNKNNKLNIRLKLNQLDFSKLPAGQGFVPGKNGAAGSFALSAAINLDGNVTVDLGALSSLPLGKKTNIEIVTDAKVVSATLTSFSGKIDPKININNTSFTINDIPDFLSDNGNCLDIANPMFNVSVENTSPIAVELGATITAYKDGKATAVVKIGAPATEAIVLEGNGSTKLCLSPSGKAEAGAKGIKVANLGSLLNTVPDRIEITDIKAQAVDRSYTLQLGRNYTFSSSYNVVVPLSFGKDMRLNYSTTDTGWNSDLGKYSFNEAVISLNVDNTIPLDMVPDVVLLDKNGKQFGGVQVTITGNVAAGSLDKPTQSQIKISVSGKQLDGLDGMRLDFTAKSNPNYLGVNLNEKQSLRFTDLKLGIKGGVTIDLN